MKLIQALNDIEWLKAKNALPISIIEAIEQDFLTLFEAEGDGENVLTFRLPSQQALILLEAGDNVLGMANDPIHLEYVEKLEQGQIEFYRIAKRIEHDFQLIYTLVGVHDEETEQWLIEQAEWNRGQGDFDV